MGVGCIEDKEQGRCPIIIDTTSRRQSDTKISKKVFTSGKLRVMKVAVEIVQVDLQ